MKVQNFDQVNEGSKYYITQPRLCKYETICKSNQVTPAVLLHIRNI